MKSTTKAKKELLTIGRKVLRKIKRNKFIIAFVSALYVTAISTCLFNVNDTDTTVMLKVKEANAANITTSATDDCDDDEKSKVVTTMITMNIMTADAGKIASEIIEDVDTSITKLEEDNSDVDKVIVEEESDDGKEEQVREYIVYKPSTHYVHRSTCHWVNDTCEEITSTEGLESRKCTECNPDIEIITLYTPPVKQTTTNATNSNIDTTTPAEDLPITEYERILLCNVVAREYGANYVPTAEKAKVVAVVMNRVRDPRYPNDIYSVLTQPYQFSGYVAYNTYTKKVTDDCIAAVNYYFEHQSEFSSTILSFYGDGTWNYFS